jgi:uncharacterized protein YbjQ (UPF0145 family)/CDGSH-type Zn-finger protein
MTNPKNILVLTTSTIDGIKVKKYIKPVSANVVAGTNLFSDLLGGISDIFGGRSQAYQKQLNSLYDEAIERVKRAAYEIGANCIIGLTIDMDEISGKGKSMFMLTAVGTAVIIENDIFEKSNHSENEDKLENVALDKLKILKRKKTIIRKANSKELNLSDENWDFITANQVYEVFPFLLLKLNNTISNERNNPGSTDKFTKSLAGYIDALPDRFKLNLIYEAIFEESSLVALILCRLVSELFLFDFEKVLELLKNDSFEKQKIGLILATADKPFYNNKDAQNLNLILNQIQINFSERGERTVKRNMLSSKEKEVWICECGKINDLETFCQGCQQDIFGFKQEEINPKKAIIHIKEKIELISELVK